MEIKNEIRGELLKIIIKINGDDIDDEGCGRN